MPPELSLSGPFTGAAPATAPWRLATLAAWLLAALWFAAHHVMWRDEIRALSFATAGDGVLAMLRGVRGDGHPALWYLLLRAGHALIGQAALPVLAFAIGATAAALWAWRAPFRPVVVFAAPFGAFWLHEYTAMARNYGLALLLMLAFAALYPRCKRQGPGLGLLLALLCSTNVPAVMLAGGLGLFWAVEIATTEGRRSPRWRHWALNMALALAGVGCCALMIFPPAADAAVRPAAGPAAMLAAALNLAAPFADLWPPPLGGLPLAGAMLAVLVIAAPFGLLRSPGGLAAALPPTLAMSLFFQLIYPGAYRHQALWLGYLLTLYWLVAAGGGGRWSPPLRPALARWGQGAFAALLLLQVVTAAGLAASVARGGVESRAADLAALLRREGLGQAVVMADADTMLEPLPYYTGNPLWLTRAGRWGRIVPFKRRYTFELDYAGLLATARRLHARTGRPVVILTQLRLDPAAPPRTWEQGYLGTLTTTPAQVRAFLAATRPLARFGPARTDERYDVYLLTRS